MTEPSCDAVSRAAGLLREATAGGVVALTGAGLSTDAGIPDFRGPQGVWTKDPAAERLSTLSAYLTDGEVRRRAWENRLASPVWSARPTVGHRALVDLERSGQLSLVITQNTDGLHALAGHLSQHVVELHGTAHWTVCWTCDDLQPTASVLRRVTAGEEDPSCNAVTAGGERCGGILKTATVSFGQSVDPAVLEKAVDAVWSCELLLAIGTTLEVQPAASLVPLAKKAGASVVVVNGSHTALDHLADVVVRGSISDLLTELVVLSG